MTLLATGDRLLNRYDIVSVEHISGLSTLYLATDMQAQAERKVALKEALLDDHVDISEEEARALFLSRAKRLLEIKHPHIIQTFDYFLQDDRSYLVTEFIPGSDLETLLLSTEGPLAPDTVLDWGITIAEAIHYLHTCQPDPIIYRDLKPSNVMLGEDNAIRLIDLGIADIFPQGMTLDPLGTDGYAAPEQYNGFVTPTIDVYALGATLHHLLTGCDPRLEKPFSFAMRPVKQYNPQVTADLVEVIDKALQFDPEQRYANALEMQEALSMLKGNT